MSDFLHMGGYGFYVWGAYGGAAVTIVAEILSLRRRLRLAHAATRSMDDVRGSR